jgi:hypothetical protein
VRRSLQALAAGTTRRAAGGYAGVGEDTFGRRVQAYADCAEQIRQKEAEIRHVATVARAAAEGTWSASAWWLERRRPQDWGRASRVELHIRQRGEALAREIGGGVTPEEIVAEAERLSRD